MAYSRASGVGIFQRIFDTPIWIDQGRGTRTYKPGEIHRQQMASVSAHAGEGECLRGLPKQPGPRLHLAQSDSVIGQCGQQHRDYQCRRHWRRRAVVCEPLRGDVYHTSAGYDSNPMIFASAGHGRGPMQIIFTRPGMWNFSPLLEKSFTTTSIGPITLSYTLTL